MKLYYAKGACSLAPHIVLEEMSLPCEYEAVNLREPTPEFLRINPLGAVPTLIAQNGQTLTEVAAILQYLGDQKPELNLIPKAGTWERYRAQEALNFVSTEMHKGIGGLFKVTKMSADPKVQEEIRAFTLGNLNKRFDVVEQRLQKSPFFSGAQFGVADAYLFTCVRWAEAMKLDLSKWPTLVAFMDGIRARPSVQRAMKAEGL